MLWPVYCYRVVFLGAGREGIPVFGKADEPAYHPGDPAAAPAGFLAIPSAFHTGVQVDGGRKRCSLFADLIRKIVDDLTAIPPSDNRRIVKNQNARPQVVAVPETGLSFEASRVSLTVAGLGWGRGGEWSLAFPH